MRHEPTAILATPTDTAVVETASRLPTVMDRYALLIALANVTTLVAGGLVGRAAYRAFKRTAYPALRAVAFGVVFIIAGVVVGGLVHLAGGDVRVAFTVQSAFTAGGFLTLLYALYVESPDAAAPSPEGYAPRWDE